jgi:NADPH:quinone reductase-like Zn-dependent oxidoreductase
MSQTMQAARVTAYGGPEVVVFETRPIPVPQAGEVLVRVAAAPVTAGDVRLRSGNVPRGMGLLLRLVVGLRRPRVAAGWGFAGEVAGLGAGVASLAIGQRVFGMKGFAGGTHAEYLTIHENGAILPTPDTLTDAEAAAFFFGGLTAAEFLIDKAQIQAGQRVLIAGATGAVGSAAVQIAAHLGLKVTALASARNHDLARRLGAVDVHDYAADPLSGPFDVIFDVMGTFPWARARPLLAQGGQLCMITADLAATLAAAVRARKGGRRRIAGTSSESRAMMGRLVALHHAGAYRPVVGQNLPFTDLPRAHAIAETFHKVGNLVVEMRAPEPARAF